MNQALSANRCTSLLSNVMLYVVHRKQAGAKVHSQSASHTHCFLLNLSTCADADFTTCCAHCCKECVPVLQATLYLYGHSGIWVSECKHDLEMSKQPAMYDSGHSLLTAMTCKVMLGVTHPHGLCVVFHKCAPVRLHVASTILTLALIICASVGWCMCRVAHGNDDPL